MHNYLRILIVEDEVIIAESLKMMIQKLGHQVVAICTTAEDFHLHLQDQKPDLALLDINLNSKISGLDLANWCYQHQQPFAYVTSYSDQKTLSVALKNEPLGYILKPFSEKELNKSLEMIRMRYQQSNKHLILKDGHSTIKLEYDDIYWLKAENVYTEIYTGDKKILHRGGLSEMLDMLPSHKFFKSHRSYAVNLDKVTKIGADSLEIGNVSVPVSRSKKAELLEMVK